MSAGPIKVAVVGHTNTGKTSLLRTLTRDVGFGEVSDRPAVTRHVEGTLLLVDGRPAIELYDTPGLEDSIGLLEHLDAAARGADRSAGLDLVEAFVESPEARGRFVQEAKALRQVLRSDLALYVIDARDRVLGKHRDELEILSRCARPVVPVLNFTASADSLAGAWREHLARVNMHAVATFDTVVVDADGERRLFEKVRTLLEPHHELIDAIIADRTRQRARLVRAASRLLAEMVVDVAAFVISTRADDKAAVEEATERMKRVVRDRESRCVRQLLELFAFRPEDGRLGDLPMDDGRWGIDLFSPAAMKQFGLRAGGAAAAGAMAGLAIDAMTGFISIGAATATGAALGALFETGRSYGKRLTDVARGRTELRCADPTIRLLLLRQVALVHALLRRGHAAVEPVVVGGAAKGGAARDARPTDPTDASAPIEATDLGRRLPPEIPQARSHPRWSTLGDPDHAPATTSTSSLESREDCVASLARWVEDRVGESVGQSVGQSD